MHTQDPKVKCHKLLNNLAETFNAYGKEARDKPVIRVLEMIGRMLIRRLHTRRKVWQCIQDLFVQELRKSSKRLRMMK